MLELVLIPILVPLAAGLLAGGLALRSGAHLLIPALILAAMIFGIYLFFERSMAFPPVSAKQKLAYLLLFGGLFAVIAMSLGARIAAGVTVAALLAGLVWIGIRKINADIADPDLLLSAAMIAVLALVAFVVPPKPARAGPWLSVLVPVSIGGALVAAFGGYLSAGQYLGSIAALGGGVALVALGAAFAGATSRVTLPPSALLALLLAIAGTMLTIILFAPSYSLPALILTLIAPLALLALPVLERRSLAIQILGCGILAAFPALAAGLIAATSQQSYY